MAPNTTTATPTTASVPRCSSRFNASDTVLWDIERDPSLRTTIVAVALLDRAPEWDRLRERLLQAADVVPRLRQRVEEAPLRLTTPRWVADPAFDLDYHVRRAVAPAPGDLDAVLTMAAPIAMAAFDKQRPLWEFTLVEGLAGGRAALIEKVHHSFTDGVGGMMLARAVVDPTRRGSPPSAVAAGDDDGDEDDDGDRERHGVSGAVLDAGHDAVHAGWAATRSAERAAWSVVSDPTGSLGRGVRGARSVARLLRPAGAPLSPLMRGRGSSRRLEAFDVPLDALHRAARAAGATLNDAFLAAVADGMRRYHARHGADVERLRVTMPVNLRDATDGMASNRFTPVRFALPVDDPDVRAQMARIGDIARRWRREPALRASDTIAGALTHLPTVATTALFGSMLKGVDLVATNVPGLTGRSYLAGAEVLAHHAFPPPSGAACGIAFVSHGRRGCVGITADTAAVPDPRLLRTCLEDGFASVLAISEG